MTGSLTLIRGVSGSGKTTLARKLQGAYGASYSIIEADQYFTHADGTYNFDASKLMEAHAHCLQRTKDLLAMGQDVIVSNTFTRKWEMAEYLKLCPNAQIIICQGRFENTHGVPPDAVARQLARFEY